MAVPPSSLSPLYAGQRFPLLSFQPIRPNVCADDTASGADHARPKGRNRNRIAECATFIRASWWHRSHVTESERTPFARMLASVIGGPR
jgi:hypothetical protein